MDGRKEVRKCNRKEGKEGGIIPFLTLFCLSALQATTKTVVPEHGFIYKTTGMKPKYTGYIPRRLNKVVSVVLLVI